jgi:hypothetical protein
MTRASSGVTVLPRPGKRSGRPQANLWGDGFGQAMARFNLQHGLNPAPEVLPGRHHTSPMGRGRQAPALPTVARYDEVRTSFRLSDCGGVRWGCSAG